MEMTNKLSKKAISEIEKELREQKSTILKNCSEKNGTELDCDGDDIDAIQGLLLTEMLQKISNRDLIKINHIDTALAKIATGTFGICEDCGDEVGKKRLLARPEASMCIICAEKAEIERKHFL